MANTTINPRTGKPWTVPTLLAALRDANLIANEEAEHHGLCEVWEEIMEHIVKETGLPFQGRGREHCFNVSVTLTLRAQEKPDHDMVKQGVIDALGELEGATYVYVSEVTS